MKPRESFSYFIMMDIFQVHTRQAGLPYVKQLSLIVIVSF